MYNCDQIERWIFLCFSKSLFILHPLPLQYTYANEFSSHHSIWQTPSLQWHSKSSRILLISAQSSQNGVPGAVSWVCWIPKSHTEPSPANKQVAGRYVLNFWWNALEEALQCEITHYRDAKTKSCFAITPAYFCEQFHANDAKHLNNIPC